MFWVPYYLPSTGKHRLEVVLLWFAIKILNFFRDPCSGFDGDNLCFLKIGSSSLQLPCIRIHHKQDRWLCETLYALIWSNKTRRSTLSRGQKVRRCHQEQRTQAKGLHLGPTFNTSTKLFVMLLRLWIIATVISQMIIQMTSKGSSKANYRYILRI